MFFSNKKEFKVLNEKLSDMSNKIEGIKINEYVYLMKDTKMLLWKNFISGISKGIGIAIGISILGAILVVVLKNIVTLNIPVIGQFISDIIDVIETNKLK